MNWQFISPHAVQNVSPHPVCARWRGHRLPLRGVRTAGEQQEGKGELPQQSAQVLRAAQRLNVQDRDVPQGV